MEALYVLLGLVALAIGIWLALTPFMILKEIQAWREASNEQLARIEAALKNQARRSSAPVDTFAAPSIPADGGIPPNQRYVIK